jgi:subtilisin family serine protease
MDIRRRLIASRRMAAAVLILALAACGGGGGGGTSPVPSPTATPTSAPLCANTAKTASVGSSVAALATLAGSRQTLSTSLTISPYTFNTYPTGIVVSVNGVPIGPAPVSTTPPYSTQPQTVSYANSTYTTPIDQTGGKARTVFYNATVDTGAIQTSGNLSVSRSAASIAGPVESTLNGGRGLERFDRSPAVASGGVYVRYDASKLVKNIDQIEKSAGIIGAQDILSSVAATRGRVLRVQPGSDVRTVAAHLMGQPGVLGVYPLHYRVPTTISRVIPSDAEFGLNSYQWDMDIIQATYAWSIAQGGKAKIAIVDTGVDLTHPDLQADVVYQASSVSGVFSTAAGAAQDTNGHGTNVAGIAAARTNDGIGFAGVSCNASILAYRIFPPATASGDEQTADTGDEATAIRDAITQGADVINLSLGSAQNDPVDGTGFDQAEYDAVEAAISAGVSVVAAAGNGDANNNALPTLDFPAAYDGVISVGAESILDNNVGSWFPTTGVFTGTTESVASYSNYGPGLSLIAPGGDTALASNSSASDNLHWIVNDSTTSAAYPPDQCKTATLPQVCGEKFQGTSQATPHVAGTVALVQSARRANGLAPLSPAAMLALLEGTADNINNANQGHGRLNTLRAVASSIGTSLVGAPTPPASSPAQFVAFAYTNSGAKGVPPAIADETYPSGVPVSTTGTFRIADIDPSVTTGSFKIAVWLDANGDGIVDAGDQFGSSAVVCTANAACHPGSISIAPVTSTISLP